MQPKSHSKPLPYNESKAEAKNPGALLGLIMGVYPVVLIVGLLAAIAFVGLRHGTTEVKPSEQSLGIDSKSEQPNTTSESTKEGGTR